MTCTLALLCASLWLSPTPSITPHATTPADTVPVDTTAHLTRADSIGPRVLAPVALMRFDTVATADTTPRRRSVAISEWYSRRLTIHRYGSYVMLPLFAAEAVLGTRLLKQKDGVYDGTRRVPIDANLRDTHRAVAYGLGGLFAVNTTTGLWNLWDARKDGASSRRRTLHVLSMLAADAGFATAGYLGARAVDKRPSDARAHRNVALASVGLATMGVSFMWF